MNDSNIFNAVSLVLNLLTIIFIFVGPGTHLIRRGHPLIAAGLVVGSFSLGVEVLQYTSYFLTGNLHVNPQLPLWLGKNLGYSLIVAGFVLAGLKQNRNKGA